MVTRKWFKNNIAAFQQQKTRFSLVKQNHTWQCLQTGGRKLWHRVFIASQKHGLYEGGMGSQKHSINHHLCFAPFLKGN